MRDVGANLSDFFAIFDDHFEAVFSEKGLQLVVNISTDIFENMRNDGVADFEF
jgi:hypothetical protein